MKKKLIILFSLLTVMVNCFPQSNRNILGFYLGESKESVNEKLNKNNYIQKKKDNSSEIYPISLELFTKPDLKYNFIPIEHITFTYCFDKLICISIVTKPIDDLGLLTNSRKIVKKEYDLEKRNFIEIDEEFYDKTANPAFYTCIDNQDFILIIYGKENYKGDIPQCYNFMYKSEANNAIDLKNKYQSYSYIDGYTNMTLEELNQKSLIIEQEKYENQKQLEIKEREKEKLKKIAEEKQQEEYNKKHRFDKFMGGMSGCWLGGGIFNGDINGGYGELDASIKIVGPLSIGADWRFYGKFKPNTNSVDSTFRMDIDAYLSLGLAIPISDNKPPIIYIAVAPGFFSYDSFYEKKALFDSFIDFRAGIEYTLPFGLGIKFVYSREFSKNNGDTNIYSLLFGGRF